MVFKYRIYNKINMEEKIVTGATQAREIIKDLLSFEDVSALSNRNGIKEWVTVHPPIGELTKIVAEWIIVNLYKEYRFTNGNTIASLPKGDFDNFYIEAIKNPEEA
jgi:hypothetical protein